MKSICIGLTLLSMMSCSKPTGKSVTTLETKQDSISYSIGMEIGMNFNTQSVDVNTDVFAQGFHDTYTESTPLLEESEMKIVTQNYRRELRLKQDELRKQQIEENKVDGEKFLAENSTQAKVIVLPSGLQYKVMTEGAGPMPTASDKVTVHYHGTFIDGTVFDSSIDKGQPASFPVTGVIAGWVEALQLMKVGAKWQLYIPMELAYGPRGRPGIEPNMALIFDVELISIKQ